MPDPIDATADVRFDPAYPWVVKSLRQSALLDGWLQQRRAAGAAPILAGFTALRSYRDQSELSVYQIVRESFVRYFVVQDGAASRSIFGFSSKGRFLDEAMRPRVWRLSQVTLDECVRQALPIYMAFSLVDDAGQKVIYEKLLLPFGAGASEVTDIVTSLKTTSWAGPCDSSQYTHPDQHQLAYSFRAVIALD